MRRNSVEAAEWAKRAGETGSFIIDKYCQKFTKAGLVVDIEVHVSSGLYISHPAASLRIAVRNAVGSYRRIKTVYMGEDLNIVQFIFTMEDILKEYNEYKTKRK